ncbi:malto-oligosyltrehalose trehalohydrolase [Tropicimonas isoalkanivorans]|uniref:Malto-oligosyltrehalose trehalohydrolase n=1 Tax=Tropicimonas isoalkanivorans TaxID=441112 RepID=A0A1I1KB22_9RHOB|nr:malto-oligosyltrehalose trehalohydrolase [Tropicimonas isoalkanivorans]SFC57956.1 malto-oligosyltrehalose trehalohydrolase [Tropicimonas isoalkanivorans]
MDDATTDSTPSDPSLFWGVRPAGAAWCARLWAPGASSVAIELAGRRQDLTPAGDGRFEAKVEAVTGSDYRFVVDGEPLADPASRAQPDGVAGPSRLVDLSDFAWQNDRPRRPWHEAVIYEMHVGTFTPEGTFAAAADRLQGLADLGITAIQLMPLNQFPGQHGWGYDGALPFAPHAAYGTPEDLCRLIDRAHGLGLMVMIDVVYNHFGPEGVTLHQIAPEFFDHSRETPWGAAIRYSQPAVRDFFRANALMWLTEYRADGFRFDAVHQIQDKTRPHVLQEISDALHAAADGPVYLVSEDERNDPELRDLGVFDAEWNDDYHHAVHCALTGESESYYKTFAVDPIDDLLRAFRDGQVEHGQPREGEESRRGKPAGHLPPTAFVNPNQTHDQVGNRALGDRLITLAGEEPARTVHAMLLCLPFVPMLFMGEERGERHPFQFFADPGPDLRQAYRDGRRAEFAGFSDHWGTNVPDPVDPATFEASKLSWADDARATSWLDLTRRCLAFRRAHVVPLVASGLAGETRVWRTGQRSVEAEWTFAAGRLRLAANLGGLPETAPDWPAALAEGDVAHSPFAFRVTT